MNVVAGTVSSTPRNPELARSLNSPLENALLAALSGQVRQRLFPKLELCELQQGTVLAKPGTETGYCYFPIDCLVSRHRAIGDEAGTVRALVGNDGIIGSGLFMDTDNAPTVSLVQVGGHAFRVDSQVLIDELNRHGELFAVLSQYFDRLLAQMAQTTLCNRNHTPEQQLCRWLLLAVDRLPGASFKMTQQQISHALCVLRPSVTQAAWQLQKEGVLNYSCGQVTLLDRSKLESLSCGCHREHHFAGMTGALKQA